MSRRAWPRRAYAGVALLAALGLLSVLGPATGLLDPDAIDPTKVLAGPELAHPLGFDSTGRDVLSRLVVAYRASLVTAVASVALALLVGGTVGLLAGYYRGWWDALLMRPVDMMLAFPALLLGVVLITILGRGSVTVILAVGGIYIPIFARVVRSSTLTVATGSYVDAARCRGSSDVRTIVRHVLPNSIGPAIVLTSILAGFAIQVEAALSFIGLGAQPPTPSLGGMLTEGNEFLTQAPLALIFPGLAIVATVAALLLIGDGLRTRLDPKGIAG